MKCIPVYCNIVHELKSTGMKTKRIWVSYNYEGESNENRKFFLNLIY
jgi:hypothetical protein